MKLYELQQLEINWAFITFGDVKIPTDKIIMLEHYSCQVPTLGIDFDYNAHGIPFDLAYIKLPFCLRIWTAISKDNWIEHIFSYPTKDNLDSDFNKLYSILKKYNFSKYKTRLKKKGISIA